MNKKYITAGSMYKTAIKAVGERLCKEQIFIEIIDKIKKASESGQFSCSFNYIIDSIICNYLEYLGYDVKIIYTTKNTYIYWSKKQ